MNKLGAACASALVILAFLAAPAVAQDFEVLEGTIDQDLTLDADTDYLLSGAVFVDNGATLTIPAGTHIFGEAATNGTLIIARRARIIAAGTAQEPIVFTSDQEPGTRSRGQWGGLVINGQAPLNVPGGEATGEGGTGLYGGNQPNDDSGILQYVRVEWAGTEFSPDNELNGIAFQGVGRGTTVEFIQVHANLDDGIEFFGGTVDARYLLCTAIGDDSFDWTDGWTGRGQFWIAQQRGDDADNGIEADNSGDNNNLEPRSNPTIYNVTFVGDPGTDFGGESDIGILLREGTAATIANAVVLGFKEEGLEIDNRATFREARRGNLTVMNSVFFNNNPNFSADADEQPAPPGGNTTAVYATQIWPNISVVNPRLRRPFNLQNPNFRPRRPSPLVRGRLPVAVPPADDFFVPVNFLGAMGPRPAQDWTRQPANWTTTDQR